MIRLAQLLLLLSAGALWGASRMVWVEVASFDGLGQPKTTALNGTSWSTALVPLAVLLLAAAVAALAVRGWPLRLLAVPPDAPVGDDDAVQRVARKVAAR